MNRNNRLNTIAYVAALFGAAMFVSCKNDINKVNALTGEAPSPETEINGFSMVRADSGFVAMRMTAGKVTLNGPERPQHDKQEGLAGSGNNNVQARHGQYQR